MSNEIHVCPVCDYVYENDPDRTCSWEELPHDYLCPACSVEKEWFQTQYLQTVLALVFANQSIELMFAQVVVEPPQRQSSGLQ